VGQHFHCLFFAKKENCKSYLNDLDIECSLGSLMAVFLLDPLSHKTSLYKSGPLKAFLLDILAATKKLKVFHVLKKIPKNVLNRSAQAYGCEISEC
jgi:hypothetical protein